MEFVNAFKAVLNNEEEFDKICHMAFKNVDTDGSGSICKSELRSIMRTVGKNLTNTQLSDKEIDIIFERIDLDHSGAIDYSEFQGFFKQMMQLFVNNSENSK